MIFQDIQSMDENQSWHATFQYLNIKSKENAGSQRIGRSTGNTAYNRYRDVVPYDHSLVQLRNSDTEYINASLVQVSSIDKKYILTQGPLAHTSKHFWLMVWEQNTYSIVMLNKVIEKNMLKCHQYWPRSGSFTFEDIKVTLKEEKNHTEFVVRSLELENLKEEETRIVKHFHYMAWPDFGVPRTAEAFLIFLLHVNEFQASIADAGPPIVHCSAGIGRSGTFALIDAALTEIKQKNDMMHYDVKKVLLEMRSYRPGLIQTTDQLRFSYIAILEGANMVAPTAYSSAYYKIARPDESAEQSVEGEPEPGLPARRIAVNDAEVIDEPQAREPNSEGEASEGQSESAEESTEESAEESAEELPDPDRPVKRTADSDTEVNDEPQAKEPRKEGAPLVSYQTVTEGEDFRKGVQTLSTASSSAVEEDKSSGESDVHEEGTDEDQQLEPKQDSSNESLVTGSEIRTTTLLREDAPTNADINTVGSGREQFETNAEHGNFERKTFTLSDIESRNESEENNEVENPSDDHAVLDRFYSEDRLGSGSAEEVVERWQAGEGDNSESIDWDEVGKSQPKRSSMRSSSTEWKRKSVTFVQENDGAEEGVEGEISQTEVVHNESTDDKNTESSVLRKREIEKRKQKLSDKVDEIKKNMKKQEEGNSWFNKTVIAGVVVCVVVTGFALFFYHYQS